MDTNTLAPPTAPDRVAAGAAQRAGAGAALFDGLAPDWFNRMDTDTLDVRNPRTCPLAQFVGMIDVPPALVACLRQRCADEPSGYLIGLRALPALHPDLPLYWGGDLGFDRAYDAERDVDITYPDLTAAWLVEIQRRRTVTA